LATLSVCIVTENEERNIEATLQTVSFANEIIIIDSYSSDRTVEICKKYTDQIYLNTYQGCGIQKKIALEKVTKEWVLILDADERLSVELQQEIQEVINSSTEYSGFIIPFQTFYLGKAIKFGDWYKERHLRLFKRDKGQITAKIVHSSLEVDGKISNLYNYILHYSFPTVERVLHKINDYSTLGAKERLQAGEKANIFTAILHGMFAFLRGYIFKLGFLDGKYGFMLAISNAQGSYYKYIKLMLLN
jgi:glycosyltransferase involved in cell wall biosynthesis